MNKILKNLIKNALSTSLKVNRNSYLGGGLVKGLSYQEGGEVDIANYDPDWRPRKVHIPVDEEVPKNLEFGDKHSVPLPENNEDLFPYLLGYIPPEGDDFTDINFVRKRDNAEWAEHQVVIPHDGKNYVVSGHNVIGQGEILEDGRLKIYSDATYLDGTYFLAVNQDDPNDTKVIRMDALAYDDWEEIAMSDMEGLNPKTGEYDWERVSYKVPDTLHVKINSNAYEDERRIKKGGLKGRYLDAFGSPNSITFLDTNYEDIFVGSFLTKKTWDSMHETDRPEGVRREDLPDE